MLGTFQSSTIRVEAEATAATLRRCLVETAWLRQWLWPQKLDQTAPDWLEPGTEFTVWLGPIAIQHRVELCRADRLQILLWGAVDGYNEWAWGNGWIQMRVEGVSLLPMGLGQVMVLRRLQYFAKLREQLAEQS
jgi:hypothetical protein